MLEIKSYKLSEIKEYKYNAKLHPKEQIEQIKESIKLFGFNDPIAIDENNVIIEGNGRYKAVKELGYKEIPCIRIEGLNEEQKKAYILVHNKLTMNSDFDLEMLNSELDNIINIDMKQFDFDLSSLENIEEKKEIVEDEVPDPPAEPKSKLGQIYQLGRHRLMCGSATSFEDVKKLINGQTINFINCDPPYGMNAVSKSGVLKKKYGTDIMNDSNNQVAIDSFNLCIKMFEDIKQVWWGANYYTECLPSAECWIVWDKANGSSDQTDCELAWTNFRSVVRQFTMASEKANRVHPTQKPCKLLQQIFCKFDKAKEFNNILDLFGGSGSTLIACEQLNRKCFMMELDSKYVDVIIERWENFTGKKAILLNEQEK